MSETLIELHKVSKKFATSLKASLAYGMADLIHEVVPPSTTEPTLRSKEFWALKDISFKLQRGQVISLIGHNGAGKTTLLRILDGLVKPSRGVAKVRGNVGALIALGAGFNPILTGRENLYLNASVMGLPKALIQKHYDSIVAFAELENAMDTPVQFYSSGMVARLGFSIGMHLSPDVMLIDEVLSVGDIGFNQKSLQKSLEMVRLGKMGILFVSHQLHTVSQISDEVIWLEKGRIKMQGNPQQVLSQYQREMSEQEVTTCQQNAPLSPAPSILQKYGYLGKHVYFKGQPGFELEVQPSNSPSLQETLCLHSHESLDLQVRLKLNYPLHKPQLVMRLLRTDGTNIWYNIVGEGRMNKSALEQTLRLTIAKPQLLEGTYVLSLRLIDGLVPLSCALPIELSIKNFAPQSLALLSSFQPEIRVQMGPTILF